MEFSLTRDISPNKQGQAVHLVGKVSTRSGLKEWSNEKKSGTRVTGVIRDGTESIDFVMFSDACSKFDELIKEINTYSFQHVSVNIRTAKLIIEGKSNIELLDLPPYGNLQITPIKDLEKIVDNHYVFVIGKVNTITDTMSFLKSNIVKVTIQDNTGTLQVSFIGEHIKSTDFHPGDVLYLSNIEHRKWGHLGALQGKTGKRTVNPTDPDCSPYLPKANTPCIDMSPAKDKAKSVTVQNMVGWLVVLGLTAL